MSFAKDDPSAQMPWAKATLLIGDIISSLFDRNTATDHGVPRCCKGDAKALQKSGRSELTGVRQRGIQALGIVESETPDRAAPLKAQTSRYLATDFVILSRLGRFC